MKPCTSSFLVLLFSALNYLEASAVPEQTSSDVISADLVGSVSGTPVVDAVNDVKEEMLKSAEEPIIPRVSLNHRSSLLPRASSNQRNSINNAANFNALRKSALLGSVRKSLRVVAPVDEAAVIMGTDVPIVEAKIEEDKQEEGAVREEEAAREEAPIQVLEVKEEKIEEPAQIVEVVEEPVTVVEAVEEPAQAAEEPVPFTEAVEEPRRSVKFAEVKVEEPIVEEPKQIFKTIEQPRQSVKIIDQPARQSFKQDATIQDPASQYLKSDFPVQTRQPMGQQQRPSLRDLVEERRDRGINFDDFQFMEDDEGEDDYFGIRQSGMQQQQQQQQPQKRQSQYQQQPQQRQSQYQQSQQQQLLKLRDNSRNSFHQTAEMNSRAAFDQNNGESSYRSVASSRSNRATRITKTNNYESSSLNGIHLSFCESAVLGMIANFRMLGLKYPRQANTNERQQATKYLVALVNNFPCEKEQNLIKRGMVAQPPIYSDRRSFNRWLSTFSKRLMNEINSPVSLNLNKALTPLKKKK